MKIKFLIILIAILSCTLDTRAQYGDTPDDQKARLLYNIPRYLLWENDENITTIYIGTVNSDPDLLKALRKEARKPYPGAGTKVEVKDYVSVSDALSDPNINILYTSYSPDFRRAIDAFKKRPVAIISDNYVDQRVIMINFVDEKSGQVSFRYSSANLRNVGISVHENITKELHGDDVSKDDIIKDKDKQLRNTQGELSKKEKELNNKQKLIDEKEQEIYDKQLTIDKQNRNIANQTRAINEQATRLNEQRTEMNRLQMQQLATQQELEQAAYSLEQRNLEITQVEAELEKQKLELVQQQKIAIEQKSRISKINDEIEEKEKELETLNLQNDLLNHRLLIAWVAIAVFLIMLFFIAKLYIGKRRDNQKLEEQNNALIQAHEEISKQKEEIANQNEKIIESILYAQKIQQAVMPPMEYFNQYLPQHFIMLKPRDIVSGDFYWGTHIGNKFVYTAADCTGHGVPGAFMSMLGFSALNEIIGREGLRKADDILNSMRETIKHTLNQAVKSQMRDGMDAALLVIHKATKMLQYAGANIPFLYYRGDEQTIIKAVRNPIGLYVNEKPFESTEIQLEKGDKIYLASDGYQSQFGGANNHVLKTSGYRKILDQIHNLPMAEQRKQLETRFEEWRGNYKQTDDIIVVGLEV